MQIHELQSKEKGLKLKVHALEGDRQMLQSQLSRAMEAADGQVFSHSTANVASAGVMQEVAFTTCSLNYDFAVKLRNVIAN